MLVVDKRPEGARVTVDMVGSQTAERPVAWTDRDAMLRQLASELKRCVKRQGES